MFIAFPDDSGVSGSIRLPFRISCACGILLSTDEVLGALTSTILSLEVEKR